MIPEPKVRKVAPLPSCRVCGSHDDLILGDGPVVCHPCIADAAVLAKATVRRNDTPDMRARGWWQS